MWKNEYVIMRGDLSSCLYYDGKLLVYTDYHLAKKTAKNFVGVVVSRDKALWFLSKEKNERRLKMKQWTREEVVKLRQDISHMRSLPTLIKWSDMAAEMGIGGAELSRWLNHDRLDEKVCVALSRYEEHIMGHPEEVEN